MLNLSLTFLTGASLEMEGAIDVLVDQDTDEVGKQNY